MTGSKAIVLIVLAFALSACATAPPADSTAIRYAETPEEGVVHIFFADPDKPSHRVASGTGFVISEDGVIVTAAHVVDDRKFIDVKFPMSGEGDAVFVPARVITTDRDRDVALLRVDDAGHRQLLRPVRLGDGKALRQVGGDVVIYGYPESNIVGLEIRRTSGTVSSHRMNPINRADKTTKMLEIEAKIEPGNSGSPVFDDNEMAIGVVSSRWETTDGYGLAVPVSVVHELLRTRYEDDLKAAYREIEGIPQEVLADLQEAYDLAVEMRARFASSDDGYKRAKSLEFCMSKALKDVKLGIAALDRREVANAWRHLQRVQHEARTHKQDIAILSSARTLLNSVE